MQPSVGRIVLAAGMAARSNGSDIAPALVTRVWSQRDDGAWLVNLIVFPDASNGQTRDATSVYLFADEESAQAALANNATVAYWPPRV